MQSRVDGAVAPRVRLRENDAHRCLALRTYYGDRGVLHGSLWSVLGYKASGGVSVGHVAESATSQRSDTTISTRIKRTERLANANSIVTTLYVVAS